MQLYNSLSGRKEMFTPADPGRPTMYVCGPTVYNHPHIGNARPAVVFDVLFRLLQRRYGDVVYVRNVTDIDDKIMAAAEAEGVATEVIAERYAAAYHEDMAALNVLAPTVEPYATGHVPEMIAMILRLLAGGPCLRGRRARAVPRAVVPGVRRAVAALARGDDRGRARGGRAVQARSGGLRAVEAVGAGAARLGQPLGARPAGLAHRMLGHGRGASRRHDRHSRRRARSQISAPRERDRPERLRARRRAARPLLAAQWFSRRRAREDVEVARQRGAGARSVARGARRGDPLRPARPRITASPSTGARRASRGPSTRSTGSI